ncbi:Putative GPN-loop GTPase, P-loop containing nucleoside triphosphate hydrolase [Septoria linicola]|uniref:GPN-loop GTPase n=1 Tax=Septoria linicola TaxID=215465 RepID=A0A9Q9EDU0_9PEZI|nr:putative GPN-loop GTPase, P-loop containing nucleoside triphosphate hydrolase [Septoria linicola]USW48091.1 Putative GPN-loop GTPase, P-loop containing nucleoside triphosphate hydrolase [Septoria linicola]
MDPPCAIVCVGMAGSGKTTFMQRINAHLHAQCQTQKQQQPPYVVNLDPAVRSVPFDSNIDIRDSVNYKEVMKQYHLGPNGGILTSLNLFTTKIDQVMAILEKRCLPAAPPATATASSAPASVVAVPATPTHIIVDTPGQIEVFVWSASGNILLSSLASTFPTVIAYIIDTPRSTENTSTFMSNMLYAISILYKTKLPMVLVFNKTDVKSQEGAVEWMRDFESFQAAVQREEEDQREGGGYMGPLLNSMSLVLEEFYNHLSVVGVSSMTGDGIDDFFEAVEGKRQEFESDYKPELARRRQEAEEQKSQIRENEVSRMMKDMSVSSKAKGTGKYASKDEPETVSDMEDMEDEDEDDHGLIERDEEEEEINAAFEEGVKARYEAALRESGPDAAASSAAAYIRSTQR